MDLPSVPKKEPVSRGVEILLSSPKPPSGHPVSRQQPQTAKKSSLTKGDPDSPIDRMKALRSALDEDPLWQELVNDYGFPDWRETLTKEERANVEATELSFKTDVRKAYDNVRKFQSRK